MFYFLLYIYQLFFIIIENEGKYTFSKAERIVYGMNASIEDFPYLVSVRHENKHVCTGNILNQKYVLTVAQCVCIERENWSGYSIQYGVTFKSNNGSNVIKVRRVHCYKGYTTENDVVINDIAALELQKLIPEKWKSASLADEEFTVDMAYGSAVVVGWAKISEFCNGQDLLQLIDVDIYDDHFCMDFFPSQTIICAEPTYFGACCAGDIGGPLIKDDVLVGMFSMTKNLCRLAAIDKPIGFTMVAPYLDWLKTFIS